MSEETSQTDFSLIPPLPAGPLARVSIHARGVSTRGVSSFDAARQVVRAHLREAGEPVLFIMVPVYRIPQGGDGFAEMPFRFIGKAQPDGTFVSQDNRRVTSLEHLLVWALHLSQSDAGRRLAEFADLPAVSISPPPPMVELSARE